MSALNVLGAEQLVLGAVLEGGLVEEHVEGVDIVKAAVGGEHGQVPRAVGEGDAALRTEERVHRNSQSLGLARHNREQPRVDGQAVPPGGGAQRPHEVVPVDELEVLCVVLAEEPDAVVAVVLAGGLVPRLGPPDEHLGLRETRARGADEPSVLEPHELLAGRIVEVRRKVADRLRAGHRSARYDGQAAFVRAGEQVVGGGAQDDVGQLEFVVVPGGRVGLVPRARAVSAPAAYDLKATVRTYAGPGDRERDAEA